MCYIVGPSCSYTLYIVYINYISTTNISTIHIYVSGNPKLLIYPSPTPLVNISSFSMRIFLF